MSAPINSTLIVTCAEDDQIGFLLVLVASLKQQMLSQLHKMDIKVLYSPQMANLSMENQSKVLAIWPLISFEPVDQPVYDRIRLPHRTHRAGCLAMESFRFTNYHRVVYIDSDQVVLKDLSPIIFGSHADITAVRQGNYAAQLRAANRQTIGINPALMVIRGQLLDESVYQQLVNRLWQNQNREDLVRTTINTYLKERNSGSNSNSVSNTLPAITISYLTAEYGLWGIDAKRFKDPETPVFDSSSLIQVLHLTGAGLSIPPWSELASLDHPVVQLWRDLYFQEVEPISPIPELTPPPPLPTESQSSGNSGNSGNSNTDLFAGHDHSHNHGHDHSHLTQPLGNVHDHSHLNQQRSTSTRGEGARAVGLPSLGIPGLPIPSYGLAVDPSTVTVRPPSNTDAASRSQSRGKAPSTVSWRDGKRYKVSGNYYYRVRSFPTRIFS